MHAARNHREKMRIVGTRNRRPSAPECHLNTVIFCRALNCRGKSSLRTNEQWGRRVFGSISSMRYRASTLQDIHLYSPSLEHSLRALCYYDERIWERICISSPSIYSLDFSIDGKEAIQHIARESPAYILQVSELGLLIQFAPANGIHWTW